MVAGGTELSVSTTWTSVSPVELEISCDFDLSPFYHLGRFSHAVRDRSHDGVRFRLADPMIFPCHPRYMTASLTYHRILSRLVRRGDQLRPGCRKRLLLRCPPPQFVLKLERTASPPPPIWRSLEQIALERTRRSSRLFLRVP